jgi:hypothetical protein
LTLTLFDDDMQYNIWVTTYRNNTTDTLLPAVDFLM